MYYKGELQPTLQRYYYRPSIHSNSHLCINAVHDIEHNWVKAGSEQQGASKQSRELAKQAPCSTSTVSRQYAYRHVPLCCGHYCYNILQRNRVKAGSERSELDV